ncbi:MAG: TrkA family potassium uptake protein [Clostridia bacterium]|nr:TrkA family potassium uptake protein [Clostridia bacterium]
MKSFCVIGLGRFGLALAEMLAQARREVLIIDNDEKKVEAIADMVDTAIIGDCTDEAVLRTSGAADYDCCIICIAENINDSVLTAILLKEQGAKLVIARAADERHARVLEKVGVDRVVLPESDIGRRLGRQISYDGVQQYMEFSEDTTIVEIEVPQRWIGKTLIELDLRKRLNINVILHKKKNERKKGNSVDPQEKFASGDLVTVIGENKHITHLLDHLCQS